MARYNSACLDGGVPEYPVAAILALKQLILMSEVNKMTNLVFTFVFEHNAGCSSFVAVLIKRARATQSCFHHANIPGSAIVRIQEYISILCVNVRGLC